MLILGIDPGTKIAGWGIVKDDNGIISHIASGTIIFEKDYAIEYKLHIIYETLLKVINLYSGIDVIVAEEQYVHHNPKSSMMLAQVRAIVMLVAQMNKIQYIGFTPTTVKMVVTGNGKAEKEEVNLVVNRWLHTVIESHDETDALAIAMTPCLVERQ